MAAGALSGSVLNPLEDADDVADSCDVVAPPVFVAPDAVALPTTRLAGALGALQALSELGDAMYTSDEGDDGESPLSPVAQAQDGGEADRSAPKSSSDSIAFSADADPAKGDAITESCCQVSESLQAHASSSPEHDAADLDEMVAEATSAQDCEKAEFEATLDALAKGTFTIQDMCSTWFKDLPPLPTEVSQPATDGTTSDHGEGEGKEAAWKRRQRRRLTIGTPYWL